MNTIKKHLVDRTGPSATTSGEATQPVQNTNTNTTNQQQPKQNTSITTNTSQLPPKSINNRNYFITKFKHKTWSKSTSELVSKNVNSSNFCLKKPETLNVDFKLITNKINK